MYNNKGYITLLSIMVVGAAALSLTTAALLSSINFSKISTSLNHSSLARSHAESCAHEALERIRINNSFVGSGSIAAQSGSCDYQIIDLGGESRIIQSTGTVDDSVKKIIVTIDALAPVIGIKAWQEVVEF